MADTKTHRYLALSVGCLLALSGCGGGGGYSAPASVPRGAAAPPLPPEPPAPVNFQAANTTVTYQAAVATATGAGHGMNNISLSAAGQGATITLTTDSLGNLIAMAIPAGGISGPTDGRSLTDPLTLNFAFELADTLQFSNETSKTLSQVTVTGGQALTASAYGEWAHTASGLPGDAGVFAFGNPTAPTSVPTTGSATFTGSTIGLGGAISSSAADGTSIYSLRGSAQIIANFATQTVTTNLTNLTTASYNTPPTIPVPDLTGTSTISGNAYAGTISGGALTGSINGNFYGSAAQETVGVWQASGGGNAFIGSFGAKQ